MTPSRLYPPFLYILSMNAAGQEIHFHARVCRGTFRVMSLPSETSDEALSALANRILVALVDFPDSAHIDVTATPAVLDLEMRVSPKDLGKVIGK